MMVPTVLSSPLSPSMIGVLIVWLLVLCFVFRPKARLPPGPRPLPLVGNVFQVQKDFEYKQYARWARKYGMS